MSLANRLFGTTATLGGQNMATNNAAQNAVTTASAYNQALMAKQAVLIGNPSASLLTKVRDTETHFTVLQANNGYIVSSRDYDNDTQQRYIASTMQEVKDLVASILVQNKLGEP